MSRGMTRKGFLFVWHELVSNGWQIISLEELGSKMSGAQPAYIRLVSKDDKRLHCPICAVYATVFQKYINPKRVQEAIKALRLRKDFADNLVCASDTTLLAPALRRQLLTAFGVLS